MIKALKTAYSKTNYKLMIPLCIIGGILLGVEHNPNFKGDNYARWMTFAIATNVFTMATQTALFAKGKKDYITE